MFKNIERKQRAIDEKQQKVAEIEKKSVIGSQPQEVSMNQMFDSKFYSSFYNIQICPARADVWPDGLNLVSRLYEHKQNSELITSQQQVSLFADDKKIEDMSLDDLVEKFLQKDSIMLTPNERVEKREAKANY